MSMGGANLLAMLSSADKKPAASAAAPVAARGKRGAAVADKGRKVKPEATRKPAAAAPASAPVPNQQSLHSLRMQVYGSCGGVAAAPPSGASKKSFKPMTADELRHIGTKFLAESAAGKPDGDVPEAGRCAGASAKGPWDWPRKYLMWPHFLPIFALHQPGPVLTANSRAVRRRQPKAAAPAPEPAPTASGRGRGRDKPPPQRDAGDWRSAPVSTRINYERTDDIENDHVGDLATLPAFFQPVDDDEDEGLGGLGGLEDDDDALEGGLQSTPPPSVPQPALSAAAKKSVRMRAKIEAERLSQRREWAQEEEEARLAAETLERERRAAGGASSQEEHSPGLLGSKPPSPQHSTAPVAPEFGGGSLLSQRISRAFGEGTPAPAQSPQQSPVQAPATAEVHSASKLLARAKMSRTPAGSQGNPAASSALHTLFASAKVVPASGGSGATALQMLQQAQRRGGGAQQGVPPPTAAPGSSAVPLQYRGGLYTHAAVEGHAPGMQTGYMPQGYGAGHPHMAGGHGMMQGQQGHPGMRAHPGYMQGGYMQQGAFQGQHPGQGQYMQGQMQGGQGGAPHGAPASQAAYMHAMSMQHAQMAYSGGMSTQPTQQGAGQFGGQQGGPAPWAAASASAQAAPQASMQAQIKQQSAAVQGSAQRQQAAASARAAAGQLLQDKAAALQAATSQGAKGTGKGKKKAAAVHRMVPTTVIKRR